MMKALKKITLCALVGLTFLGGCSSQDKIKNEQFNRIALVNGEVILGKTEESGSHPGSININTDDSYLKLEPVERSRMRARVVQVFPYDQKPALEKKQSEALYDVMNAKPDTSSIESVFRSVKSQDGRMAFFTLDTNFDGEADWIVYITKDVDREVRGIRKDDIVTIPTLRKYDPSDKYATADKYRVLKNGAEMYPGDIRIETK